MSASNRPGKAYIAGAVAFAVIVVGSITYSVIDSGSNTTTTPRLSASETTSADPFADMDLPSDTTTTTESTETTEEETPEASPTLSAAEELYVRANGDPGIETPEETVAFGRRRCAFMRAGTSADPTDFDNKEPLPKPVSDREAAAYMLTGEAPDEEAIKYLCPQLKPVLAWYKAGFTDGQNPVGGKDGVRAGTYRTVDEARDCYWARVTSGGKTIANDFVGYAPKGVTVTIRSSDGGFESQGCDGWLPVKRP